MRSWWFAIGFSILGCGGEVDRGAELAGVLSRADEALIRSRPALVAGKYKRMAGDPFSYYRGQVAVFRHDWESDRSGLAATEFDSAALPLTIGDPHPENFGILRASDGSFGFEANDFDGASRASYLWDVRRLVIGLDLAAQVAGLDEGAARAVARTAAVSYASAIGALAAGGARTRVDAAGASTILDDLFSRSVRDTDNGRTFTDLTTLDASGRHLVRGVLDPAEPTQAFADLPKEDVAALDATLASYRETLIDPPPIEDLRVLDAVREFGSGVSSWPRVRAIVLVRGPSDDPGDDRVLEVKEIADDGVPNGEPPHVFFDSVGDRIVATSRAAWARPDADPAWGVSTWEGLAVQVRTESSGLKRVSVDRLVGDRGTPEALGHLATTLGALLARVHASPVPAGDPTAAAKIAGAIGARGDAFADEQANVAQVYTPQVFQDAALLGPLLADLGPTLGVPYDASDEPSPDLGALFGSPPQ